MGSVSPLIAVYQRIKKDRPEAEFLFIGTYDGPEKKAVEGYGLRFKAISSGRFRRYLTWKNLIDPFKVIWGFWQALFVIGRFRPDAVMVAGAFVGVPMTWASWLWRTPVLIHQQDILLGLANKMMTPVAHKITVSFEISLKDFPAGKTVLTGNPIRTEILACERRRSLALFGLKEDRPLVLVVGGGTGAQKINEMVVDSLVALLRFCQVIHITGQGKTIMAEAENYRQYEFLANEMPDALCAADLVVSRSGLSILSELSVLSKPTILIPIPRSHQENNARYFQKNNAVITLSQDQLNKEMFVGVVKDVLMEKSRRETLSHNIAKMMNADGAENVARELLAIAR